MSPVFVSLECVFKTEFNVYLYWNLQIYLKYLGYDVDREDGYFSNKTLEAFKETLKPEAIRGAKINMILEHIAHEENIVVTEEEIEIELKRIAQYYSLNEEQMQQFKNANLAEFENEILKQKVFKFVVTNL